MKTLLLFLLSAGFLPGQKIQRTEPLPNGEVQVSWAATAGDFRAQHSFLMHNDWTNSNGRPFFANGRYRQRIDPGPAPQMFFRLASTAPNNFGLPTAPGLHILSFIDQEMLRGYRLLIPDGYQPTEPTPLVFVLHGSGQSSSLFIDKHPALITKARAEGVILVFPDGTPHPGSGKLSWTTTPRIDRGHEDLSFILHLLSHLQSGLNVDPRRIYSCGFSNGGVMSHQLATDTPGIFAGVAAVGASLGYSDEANTFVTLPDPPMLPASAMIVNGRQDNTRPWNGGINNKGTLMAAVSDSIDHWVNNNPCTAATNVNILAGGTVTKTLYPNCANSTQVGLVDVQLMDHIWPDAADAVNFDANEEVIDFFLAHPGSGPPVPVTTPVPTTPGKHDLTFLDQSEARAARIQIPTSYTGSTQTPIIFAFPDRGETTRTFSAKRIGLFQKCEAEDVIFVVLEGSIDSTIGVPLWKDRPGAGLDDRLFLSNFITYLQGSLNIDPNRIYATGYANGGAFVHYWAGTTSGTLAATAIINASIGWESGNQVILPTPALEPVHTLLIHGELNHLRPLAGGLNANDTPTASLDQAVGYWQTANSCPGTSVTNIDGTGTVTTINHTNCLKSLVQVRLSTLASYWPDGDDPYNYDANIEIVDFFLARSR